MKGLAWGISKTCSEVQIVKLLFYGLPSLDYVVFKSKLLDLEQSLYLSALSGYEMKGGLEAAYPWKPCQLHKLIQTIQMLKRIEIC